MCAHDVGSKQDDIILCQQFTPEDITFPLDDTLTSANSKDTTHIKMIATAATPKRNSACNAKQI